MAFSSKALSPPMISTTLPSVGPEELVNSFSHVCSEILDNVTPFKMRNQRVNKQPWLNVLL